MASCGCVILNVHVCDVMDHQEIERQVLAHLDANQLGEAATLVVEGLGTVIYGFQLKMLNFDESAAQEAWSVFLEMLWRGIGGFQRACRVRTWAYTLARNAVHRIHRDPRHAGRHVTLPSQVLADASHRVLTTAVGMDTAEDRFHAYFAELEEEEQWLLVLRVQRVAWEEIAQILNGEDILEEGALRKASARLRRRYSRLVKRLREQAARDGVHL